MLEVTEFQIVSISWKLSHQDSDFISFMSDPIQIQNLSNFRLNQPSVPGPGSFFSG